MSAKTSDWRPGPTVCRCCLSEGCYKDISTEYFWMGKREVYAEMLSDTLNVTIAYSKSGPNSNSRLICEPCISRLRDAHDFKRQVLECEKTFMQYLDPGSENVQKEMELSFEEVKVERVKQEKKVSDDEDMDDRVDFVVNDDSDDELDNEPLMKLASKVPKKEKEMDLLDLLDNSQITVKRKSTASTSKSKEPPAKKAKKREITIKPSASKATASKTVEKKKKGIDENQETRIRVIETKTTATEKRREDITARKKRAYTLIENSRIFPFRWTKNLYFCFYCDEQFTDPQDLRKHQSDHSIITPALLRNGMRLKKYELIKVDITDIGCKLCDDTIQNFKDLKIHLRRKHGKDIELNSDGVLPFKVNKDSFKCALCDKRCDEFKSLNHHMNVHYQNFICEQCGSGFVTPDRLRVHAFSHETGAFKCESEGCEKVFRSKNNRNEHHAIVHMKRKRHRCPQCPETFINYFQRSKHISSIHGVKLKEFKCDLCPKVYTLSGKLGVHVRTVHMKIKRFSCDVCSWKVYSRAELKQHMMKHVAVNRKFMCHDCNKTFSRGYSLKQHMKAHEIRSRFVCGACGKVFVQASSLDRHAKTYHAETDIVR